MSTRVSAEPAAVSVEVVGGTVAAGNAEFAVEKVRHLCRLAPRAVHRGGVHLCADVDDHGRSAATADAILVLDADLVICAGAVATTVREAVDELSARLRQRITAVGARPDYACTG
jgi:hypothetical protein